MARGIEFNAENSTRAGPFPPKFRTAVELNPNIAAVDKDKRVDVVSSIHGFRSVAEFVALRAGALALAHDRTVDECLCTRRPSARRVGETTSALPWGSARASVVVLRSRVVRRTPRPDVVDGDPVHGTGGRAFAILRVLGCQSGVRRDGNLVVPAMDFRPATYADPPEPRPVLVVVVDEDGRRPCGFDCHRAGAAAPCAWVCDRPRWRPSHRRRRSRSAPGGSSRRRRPCPDGRLVPAAVRRRPRTGPPLNHRRADGRAGSSRPESVVSSSVSSRYEVVLESWRCPRPAQGVTSAAMPFGVADFRLSGVVLARRSVRHLVGCGLGRWLEIGQHESE